MSISPPSSEEVGHANAGLYVSAVHASPRQRRENGPLAPTTIHGEVSGGFVVLTAGGERQTAEKQKWIRVLKRAVVTNHDGRRLDIKVPASTQLPTSSTPWLRGVLPASMISKLRKSTILNSRQTPQLLASLF
ncbi:hypothetical protein [Allorhodopirellula heiligendammensis]|uniref:hypothetical protein n=1 Tax=Allorhodopirellula heiligendammensis TaxID=2714739 RepID=UPI0011B55AA2|nr:hypothetical protein [Allorhodopirellula heiligendammensis]